MARSTLTRKSSESLEVKTEPRIQQVDTFEIPEPTVESRLSGLEYRVAHPNKQTLEELLADSGSTEVLMRALDKCHETSLWKDCDNAKMADRAKSAEYADCAPAPVATWLATTALVLVVIGLALGFAAWRQVRSINLAAAIKSPLPVSAGGNYATSLPIIDRATGVTSMSITPEPSSEWTTVPSRAAIRITPSAKCWISVHDAKGKLWLEKTVPAMGPITLADGWDFNENKAMNNMPRPLEIRAGCPGAMKYEVDGKVVHPKNHAVMPLNVELVTLP
jgi:hypothetical protein